MATIVMLEALGFGVDELSRSAERRDAELVLFTFDRPYYEYGLARHDHVRVVDVDTFDIDAVRAALDSLGPVDGLISNTDTWSGHAETLAIERGFPHVARNIALLRDKVRVRNTLFEAGLSGHRAVRASEWADPPAGEDRSFIVKDASGTGSRHVLFAESAQDVGKRMTELIGNGLEPEGITVEPYFKGPLYSAETYTTATGTTLFGVTSRTVSELPDFRELDLSYPVGRGTPWESSVRHWVSDVLSAIGRGIGPSHVEFVDTGSGFEVVEVNCRLGGFLVGHGIELVNGLSPYDLLIGQALAEDLDGVMGRATTPPVARAYAQVAKYAGRTGRLGTVLGTEGLRSFPGEVAWHPILRPEATVLATDDQRSAYGLVTATGPAPDEALRRAHAAARHVRIAGR
ncbi:argininosuccinate lyase [Streptomyces sp. 150FB]|uniref:argininosuccinate lyase n=1 Tax=Streptomyces sp. 150FB TaxID=1576605 RepID=UPI0012378A8D|nr:argininosuccinate lyase [Streptomyces sp. 150FB]